MDSIGDLVRASVHAVYRGTRSEELATSVLCEVQRAVGTDRKITTITTLDVENLIGYYRDQGNGPATINRKLAVFSRALRYARDCGVLLQPLRMRKLREPAARTRVLTQEEQALLLLTAESYGGSLASFFRFLLGTGCRVSEALNLKWSRVDLERQWVRFEETKGDKPRGVPISGAVAAMLRELKSQGSPGPFSSLSQRQVTYGWNKCRKVMSLELDTEFVPHSLRHTCATEMVGAGVSIQLIQRWLGHKTLSMTQRYAHVHDDMLVAALFRRTNGKSEREAIRSCGDLAGESERGRPGSEA